MLLQGKVQIDIKLSNGYFLAGMVGVETHRLIENGLSLDAGNLSPFYTSSSLARANAALLHLQVREILKHNPRAGQYVNAPLNTVFKIWFLKNSKYLVWVNPSRLF